MNQPPQNQVNALMGLVNRGRLLVRLMKDPRVPTALKAIPILPLAYVVFPIDIVPDFIPVLGQLDDIGAVLLGIETFISLVPNDIVVEHQNAIAGHAPGAAPGASANDSVIDGSWREVK
ncbi:MAG TPA: DUF1232 domain-containing protein [Thermoflexales bacterium]|nr:DUF1232 domain-containing protein [Thermoflexales bacterium]HQW34082.1 DUF1232 domain-containing protein [Thermoflexales bacterium]HQZ21863.1 DUF1232 domain-containing protein [Thermoflexales bacterium]HQZ99634.1 DUF1232 domain-containing protein [Thermoflexales bacterium]